MTQATVIVSHDRRKSLEHSQHLVIGNQLAIDSHSLMEGLEVRRCVNSRLHSSFGQDRTQHRADAAFAFGAGHVNHRVLAFRRTQAIDQSLHLAEVKAFGSYFGLAFEINSPEEIA